MPEGPAPLATGIAIQLVVLTSLLGSGSALAAANSAASPGAPFAVRDQNPFLAGFGLPLAMPPQIVADWSARVDLHWGSTALMQEHGNEALLVDAETREARVTLQGPLTERTSWQLQLPYRYTGAGSLDGFIDRWHDFFGLAEGARSALPSDRMNIEYRRAGVSKLDVRSSASGLADVQVALGYAAHTSSEAALMTWLSVKLPTGEADRLTGSGAMDVSLLLSGRQRIGERWTIFGQAAATWLGAGDLLPAQQRSFVGSGMAGLSVQTWRGLSLKAQIDAHSAAYDSDLDFFGEAVMLTLGGDYRFASGWRLDLGVSEDIAVEHSPDVVFVLSLRHGS